MRRQVERLISFFDSGCRLVAGFAALMIIGGTAFILEWQIAHLGVRWVAIGVTVLILFGGGAVLGTAAKSWLESDWDSSVR